MRNDLELAPYQSEAAAWLQPRKTAMIVGDPGVGKTPIACFAAMVSAPTFMERILVFCPPIATAVWEQHFRDWTSIADIRVAGFVDRHSPYQFTKGRGVRIVGYSRARDKDTGLIKACRMAGWDVAILDEVHALKSPGAERTRAVYGRRCDRKGSAIENADRVWCLTGTPLLNHSAEFWTHLRALYPEGIEFQGRPLTYEEFAARYANRSLTPFGWRVTGSRKSDELAERIRPFVKRIRIRDVIKDLPDLRVVETPLPQAVGQTPASSALGDMLDDDALLAELGKPGSHLATHRRLLGERKALGVSAFVADQLEDAPSDKIIVFAHHQSVIQILDERLRLYSPLVINGQTPGPKRQNFIHAFQNDPRYRVIILAIDAAGEAITLTAARHVVFCESSWTPARNSQAIARSFRRGQKNAVLARFMVEPGTLDERIMRICADKARGIARVVDHHSSISREETTNAEDFPVV